MYNQGERQGHPPRGQEQHLDGPLNHMGGPPPGMIPVGKGPHGAEKPYHMPMPLPPGAPRYFVGQGPAHGMPPQFGDHERMGDDRRFHHGEPADYPYMKKMEAPGIDAFNKNIITNVITELTAEQANDNNNSNQWDGDAFSGQQGAYPNMLGQMGAEDDGHSRNINFEELRTLWERNLQCKVAEGKRKAQERDRTAIHKMHESGRLMPYYHDDHMGGRRYPPPVNGPFGQKLLPQAPYGMARIPPVGPGPHPPPGVMAPPLGPPAGWQPPAYQ